MELIRVQEINNYRGKLYIIKPRIENGKIKRKAIFTGTKTTDATKLGVHYGLSNFGRLFWHQTIFHILGSGETVDENTIANNRTIRFFTEREEAKKALEEYEAQNAYKLNESIDRELTHLEAKKKKINDEIKALKERRKECFKHLTTTFSKKS